MPISPDLVILVVTTMTDRQIKTIALPLAHARGVVIMCMQGFIQRVGSTGISHPWGWFPLPRISKVHIENSTKVLEHVWFPPFEGSPIDNPVLIPVYLPQGWGGMLLHVSSFCIESVMKVKLWQPKGVTQMDEDPNELNLCPSLYDRIIKEAMWVMPKLMILFTIIVYDQ